MVHRIDTHHLTPFLSCIHYAIVQYFIYIFYFHEKLQSYYPFSNGTSSYTCRCQCRFFQAINIMRIFESLSIVGLPAFWKTILWNNNNPTLASPFLLHFELLHDVFCYLCMIVFLVITIDFSYLHSQILSSAKVFSSYSRYEQLRL